MTPNYYEILGIPIDASSDDILKAYRVRGYLTHPNKAKSDSSDKFILVYESYRVLNDRKLRKEYDEALKNGKSNLSEVSLEEFRRKAWLYVDEYKGFQRDFYSVFLFEILFADIRLPMSAFILIIFGIWSIVSGGINHNNPVLFVGCGLLLIGIATMIIGIRYSQRRWPAPNDFWDHELLK
jgi:curved DNA-binding protein CbpA